MDTPDITLQRWQDLPADEQAQLRALRISAGQIEYAGTMERAIAKLESGQGEDLVGLAIRQAGAVVGFVMVQRRGRAPAWADPLAATISAMRIDEGLQGRGLGAGALHALAGWVRQHWPEAKALTLSVDEENTAGQRAYRKAGFVDHGTRVAGRIGWVRYMSRPLDETVPSVAADAP